jgi:hypothetical protein
MQKTAVVQKGVIHTKIKGLKYQQTKIYSDESCDQFVHFLCTDNKDSANEECIYFFLPVCPVKSRENLIHYMSCVQALKRITGKPVCESIALKKQSHLSCDSKLFSLHTDITYVFSV